MADEEAGIGLWEAVAEFFCMLTPQQFLLLPNLIAINIFCTANENSRFLIADFFSLLGQALATISSQPTACDEILKKKQPDSPKSSEPQADDDDGESVKPKKQATQDELETGVRANPAEENPANAMAFE